MGDMPSLRGPVEDTRESISQKIKQQGGDGVPLPEATTILKVGAYNPIHVHSSMATRDQLHQTLHICPIETLS